MKANAQKPSAHVTTSAARPFFAADHEQTSHDGHAATEPTFFRPLTPPSVSAITPAVQTKCAECEAEELQANREDSGQEAIVQPNAGLC